MSSISFVEASDHDESAVHDVAMDGSYDEDHTKNERDGVVDNHNVITISYPDVYSSWNSTSTCDRRLSRAARSLLRERILRYIFPKHEDVVNKKNNRDEINVWDLLDRWLMMVPTVTVTTNSKAAAMLEHSSESSPTKHIISCPLLPSRDVYREEEAHVVAVNVETISGGPVHAMQAAYPNHVLRFRRSTSPRRPDNWYRCNYCGKMFSTRFYLDLHMSRYHDDNQYGEGSYTKVDTTLSDTDPLLLSTTDEMASLKISNRICPAVDWCRLVGVANCHEKALQDEPYYDRGSGGWGEEDRTSIEHKWKKIAHSIPCTVDTLQRDCRSMLRACGLMEEPINKDGWAREGQTTRARAAEQFCQHLTCPHHRSLWHFFDDGITLSHGRHTTMHERGRDVWTEEIQHHRRLLSIVGTIIVVGLLAWIIRAIVSSNNLWRWQRRDDIPAGQRLLFKGPRRSSSLQGVRRGRVSDRVKRD